MISISGAETMEVAYENVYAGNQAFSLRKNKTMRIEGIIYKPQSLSGASGVLAEITEYTADEDYQPIYINGEYFGSGQIQSMTFPVGNYVRLNRPTVIISFSELDNPQNINGNVYFSSIYQIVQDSGHLIDELTDTLNLNKDRTKAQTLDYDFRIRFGHNSGITQGEYTELADMLEKNLFYTNFNTNFMYDQVSGLIADPTVRFEKRKRADLINNTLDYSRKYTFRDNTGCLIETFSHDVTLGEDEVFNVTENYEGRYLCGDSVSYYDVPSGVYERCSGIAALYGLTGLKTGAVSFNSVNDRIEKISSYQAAFSDDLRPITGCLAISFIDINFDYENNAINRAYNNSFRGYGISSGDRYNNAKGCFLAFLGITGYSTGVPIPDPMVTGDQILLDKNLSISNYQGIFNFNWDTTNHDVRRIVTRGSGDPIDTYVIYRAPRLIAEQRVGYAVPSYRISVQLDLYRTGNWQAAWASCTGELSGFPPNSLPHSLQFGFSYPAYRATMDAEYHVYPIQLTV